MLDRCPEVRETVRMAAQSSPQGEARRGQPLPDAQAVPAQPSKAARRREAKAVRKVRRLPRCEYCGAAAGLYRVHTGLWTGEVRLCAFHLAKAERAAHVVSVTDL